MILAGTSRLLDSDNPVNWDHPLNAGLISHWQSIRGSAFWGGPVVRDLASAKRIRNSGTLKNGAKHDGMSRAGGYGSWFFDGSNDHTTWGVPTVLPVTISCWYYVPGTLSGNHPVVMQAADAWNSSTYNWSIETNSTNLWCYPNANTGIVNPSLSSYTGTWLHICFVRKDAAGVGKVYFNGVVAATGTDSGTLANTQAVRQLSSSIFPTGYIDEIELRSNALTPEMVRSLYAESRAGSLETLNWLGRRTYSFSGGGATTYTATAAVTIGAATCSGAGTFTKPTYAAAAAVTVGATTAAGSATFTKPQYTAAAGVTTAPVTCAGSATFTKPTFSATAGVTVAPATCAGSAIFANAVYQASAAVTVGKATAAGSATFTKPTYTGTVGATVGAATCAGAATFTKPVFTGSAAVTVGRAVCQGSAIFASAVFQGAVNVTVAGAQCSGVATFDGSGVIPSEGIPDEWYTTRPRGEVFTVRPRGEVFSVRDR